MKVKFFSITLLILAATFLVANSFTSKLSAQADYSRIVFIDAARALASHPAGGAVAEIQERQEEELGPILQQIQELQRQAAERELTPEEQDLADILIRTLQERQQLYAEEILQASEPAVNAVNAAITAISASQGYSMVLDGNIAGQNGIGLVVYAVEGLDITDQVIEYVKQNP